MQTYTSFKFYWVTTLQKDGSAIYLGKQLVDVHNGSHFVHVAGYSDKDGYWLAKNSCKWAMMKCSVGGCISLPY
jgi:hypothetical protein